MDISLLDSMFEKYAGEVPGVAVLAVRDGIKVYNKQFGLANMEYKIPIKENTAFNIASITKQFTAMGIMILAEDGKLGLNDSIVKYIPEISHYCGNVTIRCMLNNTSGIENYYRILERVNRKSLAITNEDVLNLLFNENSLLFSPGEKFDYSNSNYVLLAVVIERVTGLSYDEFMNKNIFSVLGMKNSFVFDEKQPIISGRAYGYRVKNDIICCDYYDALTTGDGGVFSTTDDLYLWDQALYTDKLVGRGSIELAFTPGKSNKGRRFEEDYGFGWAIGAYNGTIRLWHSGLDAGFRSLITRFPEDRITIVLLSNNSEFLWGERLEITNRLYEMLSRK